MPDQSRPDRPKTRQESRGIGKAARQRVPRGSHGEWQPAADRPDPISILQAQDDGRIKHLLPIKYGRMLESPFAFLRGSAAVMSADLAGTPVTGMEVVLCGDAHLSNFGVFATPERQLVFDINDFDETYPGPWEWDLKRLAASAVVAGRENGFKDEFCREMAVDVVYAYRKATEGFARMNTLDVWYYHIDTADVLEVFGRTSKRSKKSAEKMLKKARRKTHQQTMEKLTGFDGIRRRIISDPPLLVPVSEMGIEKRFTKEELRQISEKAVESNWSQYLESLPDERRFLLQRYKIVDAALRVGGIGSVGTRCIIVLLDGGAEDDALILQLKEAGPSVLEPYFRTHSYECHGQRVVTGQRLMQAASDIFLGWHTSLLSDRDFYWRQLKDMKGSADIPDMDEASMRTYLGVCSLCLASAHARTGDEARIWGYIGRSDRFAEAVGDFAVAYADQTERDYDALVKAVKSDRVPAETGI